MHKNRQGQYCDPAIIRVLVGGTEFESVNFGSYDRRFPAKPSAYDFFNLFLNLKDDLFWNENDNSYGVNFLNIILRCLFWSCCGHKFLLLLYIPCSIV